MRKFIIFTLLLSVLITFTRANSEEWTKFATMKVQGTDVTLYGDKTSLQIDENDSSKRTLMVKFELSDDMKSEYNDGEYRTRREEYYFDCDGKRFTVAQTKLINAQGETVYDSGFHDPFSPDYEGKWYRVSPGSGPEIIYNKVCLLGKVHENSGVSSDTQQQVSASDDYEGYKKSGYVTGGNMTDGLDVMHLRWAPRKDFERLVFDVYDPGDKGKTGSAKPVEVPGYFEVSMPQNEKDVRIKLSGYRSFSAQTPDIEGSKLIEDIIVSRDKNLSDKSGYIVNVKLKDPAVFKAFELHKPGRIVVDLKKIN